MTFCYVEEQRPSLQLPKVLLTGLRAKTRLNEGERPLAGKAEQPRHTRFVPRLHSINSQDPSGVFNN